MKVATGPQLVDFVYGMTILALFVAVAWPIMKAAAAKLEPSIRRWYGVPPPLPVPVQPLPRLYRRALKFAQLLSFMGIYVFLKEHADADSSTWLIAVAIVYAATYWLYLIAERAAAFSRWVRSPRSSARARALGSSAAGHRLAEPASRYIE